MPARAVVSAPPALKKRVDGCDLSDKNAFARTLCVELLLHVPRAMGVSECHLLLTPDGEGEETLPFCFFGLEGACDVYRLCLPLGRYAPPEGALLFYRLRFRAGGRTLYSDTDDNCSLCLSEREGRPFRLLAYREGLAVPKRFFGRLMYQIFPDRFCRAGRAVPPRGVLREDWAGEIEQFARYPGEAVANNEFFGGTLWGVLEKLEYLQALGVGVIYLCPIFEAASNHRYDTGDYERVAAELGGEQALRALLQECHRRGIAVILDGVFNHTGDDSKYFNKYGRYPTLGAYQSADSPYRTWYELGSGRHGYVCWWDIPILPRLKLDLSEVRQYFLGERGIVARYLQMGVDGWRLDVADELPDCFLDELHLLVKEKTGGNGVIFGEVWENAADKIAYGVRRRYLRGGQLDGVMNYPLREGIVAFVRDRDAGALARVLRELWSSYPTPVCHMLMNLLSSHDTARILTVLGGASPEGRSQAELRGMRMGEAERGGAKRLLMLAAVLQYTVYGIPCLYYGDEAGMEGYGDPFCRRTYPWGREDQTLLTFYKKLGKIRGENTVFREGDFRILRESEHAIVFERVHAGDRVIVAVNRGEAELSLRLPGAATELLSGRHVAGEMTLSPDTAAIWRIEHV